MQKIPTSVEANKKFEQIEHVEAVNSEILSDQETMLNNGNNGNNVRLTIGTLRIPRLIQRIADLESRLASLETKAVDSAKFDSDKSSLSEFGSVLFF